MYFIFVPPTVSRTAETGIDTCPQVFYHPSMLTDANAAVQATYSSDWGRIVATLIRSFGDFDLAEEAAQEAFAAAVDQWRNHGIPDSPPAWIIQTARHKAIDRLRRQTRFQEKVESYVASGLLETVEHPELYSD